MVIVNTIITSFYDNQHLLCRNSHISNLIELQINLVGTSLNYTVNLTRFKFQLICLSQSTLPTQRSHRREGNNGNSFNLVKIKKLKYKGLPSYNESTKRKILLASSSLLHFQRPPLRSIYHRCCEELRTPW